jgi:hypothetical protein
MERTKMAMTVATNPLGAQLALFAFGCLAFAMVGCQTPCEPYAREATYAECGDGLDNDGDGQADCLDLDCAFACPRSSQLPHHDAGVGGPGDATPEPDSSPDADGAAPEDGSPDGDAADGLTPDGFIACASTEDCPEDLRCYDYALDGRLLCGPRGAACYDGTDCSPGVECGPLSGIPALRPFCLARVGTCAAAADCPDGFRCEAGACVDRRLPCVRNDDCPHWERCGPLPTGVRVCVPRSVEPCSSDDECWELARCVDIDGDGATECQDADGSLCMTNADCRRGVCSDQDGAPGAECGVRGPCRADGDCPVDRRCVDVNGDGQPECQLASGDCAVDMDCPSETRCLEPSGAGRTTCAGR